jgi:serine/threonine protein kinase
VNDSTSEQTFGHALWRAPPDGYTLGPCIGGRPGVSLVFAAHDDDGRPCALKTLHPAAAQLDVQVVRFACEIAAHIAASGAPNVVRARVIDQHGGWLIMDWAHGGDMARGVEHSAVVRARVADSADHFAEALLDAISALHDRGVIHRDIKPSNLLLDGDDVWLSDFGIAAMSVTGAESWRALPSPFEERTVGTPSWAPPELSATPPAVTPATDVYGVGRVWQWMLELRDADAVAHTPRGNALRFDELRERLLAPLAIERPSARDALRELRAAGASR